MKKLALAQYFLIAAVVAGQSALAQVVDGNATEGAKKVAQCMGCHGLEGYHASFPEVYRVPKIAGQGAKYIASALLAYQKGERRHPTMRGVVSNLSEKDIADVSAYYAAQGRSEPTSGQTGDHAAAEALVVKAGCRSCHGESLSKPIDPSYPKIAGQYGDYLFVALKSYKMDPNAVVGRSNPVMGGIAKQFDVAELKLLADYVSSLPGELRVASESKFR